VVSMTQKWLVAAGTVALVAAGCGGAKVPLPDDASYVAGDATRGREVYQANCKTCHSPEGTGVKGSGPALVPVSAAQATLTEAEQYRYLRARHAKLPKLTDDEVRDVSAFMLSLRQK